VQPACERISVGAWFLVSVFQAGFAEKISIKVRLKIFRQGLMKILKSRFD
jgi:hypothetical protein